MDWKLELVMVPVTDVDRALAFYRDQVGFAVDHDTPVSDTTRVAQLTPPGSACSIAIGTGIVSSEPGSSQGMQLVVDDIEDARAELVGRGVDVGPVQHYEAAGLVDGRGGPWNSFLFFTDPDGNGWAVQERAPGR
jgi:catechol 2,3-dioxygenase-like lactoylglutathione lyase family enzyme